MIREIFITDLTNKVLFGDLALYPSSPSYPLHIMDNNRLCQLKINDVILSILYENMDSFTAAKYLYNLKAIIVELITEINEKNVCDYYFSLLELLHGCDVMRVNHHRISLNLNLTDDTYIDVVESVHTVITKNGTVLENTIYGSVLLSKKCEGTIKMTLDKGTKYKITAKSNYKLKSELDKIELTGKNISSSDILLNYNVPVSKNVLISMKRLDNKYTFMCPEKLKFKFIRFMIPVSNTTFSVKTHTSSGYAKFDAEKNTVIWDFDDGEFFSEAISIERHALEETVDKKPIKICFTIQNWCESGLSVKSCINEDCPLDRFWITHTTQDGHYEIIE
ncbi:AP-1 complex subunit mu [Pancytospora epiphaga]|nr:AP-1 complex subunit mu [Pancytospora epiphaga]